MEIFKENNKIKTDLITNIKNLVQWPQRIPKAFIPQGIAFYLKFFSNILIFKEHQLLSY